MVIPKHFKIVYSEAFQKRQYILTGEAPEIYKMIPIDSEKLTPEQRQVLVENVGKKTRFARLSSTLEVRIIDVEIKNGEVTIIKSDFSYEPSVDTLISIIERNTLVNKFINGEVTLWELL